VRALVLKYQDYLMPEPPQGEGPDKNGEKPDMKKPGNKKPGTDNHQGKRQEYEKKLKKILTDDQYKSYCKAALSFKASHKEWNSSTFPISRNLRAWE